MTDHSHDDLEVTSTCCGKGNYYGFCGGCYDHTDWVKYCPDCDKEFPCEEPLP